MTENSEPSNFNYEDSRNDLINIFTKAVIDGEFNLNKDDKKKLNFEKLKLVENDFIDVPSMIWAAFVLYNNDKEQEDDVEDLRIDFDVSHWAVYLYQKKYEFLNDGEIRNQDYRNSYTKSLYKEKCLYKYEIEIDGNTYRGDTMTSFSNFIRQFHVFNKQAYSLDKISKRSSSIKVLQKKGIEKQHFSKKFTDDKKLANLPDNLSKFASLVHSEGNLIPVPLKFNNKRSGDYGECDYWDLTMLCIFNWCRTSDDRYIEKLLNPYNKNDEFAESKLRFKRWMGNFHNNWFEFVKKNYLQAFVNDNIKGWPPIEFWDYHFLYNRKIDELSKTEFNDAIVRICDCIDKREKQLKNIKIKD